MSDGDHRATVRLLAVLVMTPVDELLEFKRRCLDKGSRLSGAQLRAAQELLVALGAVLKEGDEDDWRRIQEAREVRSRAKKSNPAEPFIVRPRLRPRRRHQRLLEEVGAGIAALWAAV